MKGFDDAINAICEVEENTEQLVEDKIRSLSSENLAKLIYYGNVESIEKEWCTRLCPHRCIETEEGMKCDIDGDEVCPVDGADLVLSWLKAKAKENDYIDFLKQKENPKTENDI